MWVIDGEQFRSSPVVLAAGSRDHSNVSSRDTTTLRRVNQCRREPCSVPEVNPGLTMALYRVQDDLVSCCKRLETTDPMIILPAMLEAWNQPGARESYLNTTSQLWIDSYVSLCAYETLLRPGFPYKRASLSLRTLRLSTYDDIGP